MAKVSIIIPVYNVENYLEKALESVCVQTLKDIEIICINDCSTDNSIKILKKYKAQDERIKIIHLKQKHNPGFARNLGISNAKGDYLMFLDSDDWLAKNACEIAYNHINNSKADVSSFNYYIYYEKIGKIKLKDCENKSLFFAGIVWKNIYNTSFIKNNNILFGNVHVGEDNIFYIKSIMLANSITFINKPLYYYRKRANASSITDSAEYCFDAIKAKEECYKIAQSYPENSLYNDSLAYSINTILYMYQTFSNKIVKKSIKKEYFYFAKRLLKKIFAEVEFTKELNEKIEMRDCKKIIKYDYEQYQIVNFLDKIFSIYLQKSKLHINILGIRLTCKI